MEAADLSDPTGKGNTVAFDYVAGTNPNDRADRLEFTDISVGSSQASLEWKGALGRWYQILHSTTMAPGSWNILDTIQCSTDKETLSIDFSPSETKNFFKISVSLEDPRH